MIMEFFVLSSVCSSYNHMHDFIFTCDLFIGSRYRSNRRSCTQDTANTDILWAGSWFEPCCS